VTPAEILAATRPIKRSPRNLKPYARKVSWVCHCRTIREGLKLSFDEVVRALKISRTAYWQIEKGGDLMLTTATRIATFYGKEVSELWTPIKQKTK